MHQRSESCAIACRASEKINFPGEIKIIPSPKPFAYRARAQWHVDRQNKNIGYYQRNSHRIIDVENCPILTPELNETLEDLRNTIVWESFWSEIVEIEAANADGKVSIFSDEILEATEEIEFKLNENSYFYSANTFFQGNPFLIESLINTAISGASGKTALDLYCGVGLFTLPLAENFAKVTGVEGFNRAIDYARKNAENARLENIEFQTESVADFLKENINQIKNVDFVLLDPPRAGTEKETIENIVKLQPKEISYVSCEPSILARDLTTLTANGYQIESITAIDLFPQTHHVETIVRLINKYKNLTEKPV